MLDLPAGLNDGDRLHLSTLAGRDISGEVIHVADHCYGCTAGQGSGCNGAF